MLAENCAESATTAKPQTMQTVASRIGLAPNRKPVITAQTPLTAMAVMVTVVRP